MATRNLSATDQQSIPDASGMRFGIAVADWNPEITGALLSGCVRTLCECHVSEEDIEVLHVPGSFELPLAGQFLAEMGRFDAVILLGCVIQGETRHFDYICQGVTQGIMDLNLKFGFPFIFGILTTLDHQQAADRAGGKHGNKGDEAAHTAIRMVAIRQNFR